MRTAHAVFSWLEIMCLPAPRRCPPRTTKVRRTHPLSVRPASAQTAFGPMVIAAAEQNTPAPQRLIDDQLAIRFLPPRMRLIVRACRWRPVHNLLVRVTDGTAPGMWGSMLCRKRYVDDTVAQALASGVEQVMILGAGLDTRQVQPARGAGPRVRAGPACGTPTTRSGAAGDLTAAPPIRLLGLLSRPSSPSTSSSGRRLIRSLTLRASGPPRTCILKRRALET